MLVNYALLLAILAILIGAAIYYARKVGEDEEIDIISENLTEKYIIRIISETIAQNLKEDPKEMNASRQRYEAMVKRRQDLRTSLKEAAYGNGDAKVYLKSIIQQIIRTDKNIKITAENVDSVIRFSNPGSLRPKDKFEILVYLYTKEYGDAGLTTMIDEYELAAPKYRPDGNIFYEISDEDINRVYADYMMGVRLDYADKIEILAQRFFEMYKGFGVADLLFESTVDEIDCGVSGLPSGSYDIKLMEGNLKSASYSYESIWITYHGVNIRMSCLSFGSQEELIRVCQNVYKFNAPYALSRRSGYVVATMKNGSRVVVARPPFADSWCCFIRKFDSTPSIAPQDLFKDPGAECVIVIIKALITGLMNIMITGDQGTGKTTTLKSVLRFVPEYLTLRIEEKAFEMNLRYVYTERNVVTFQETESITMQDGLDLQKKTNGCVNVFGEIASRIATNEYLQTCRVASMMGIGTHHAKTARDLVRSFAVDGETEETVSQTINFDIHMKNEAGHRFCQRITEIVPIRDRRYPSEKDKSLSGDGALAADTMEYQKRMTDRQVFEARDIVRYENGRYVLVNLPTEDAMHTIEMNMPANRREEFKREWEEMVRGFGK